VDLIEWLIDMIPEDTSYLLAKIRVLEEVAVRLNRLDILNAIRASKHKKYIRSVADILRKAVDNSEFEIFCRF